MNFYFSWIPFSQPTPTFHELLEHAKNLKFPKYIVAIKICISHTLCRAYILTKLFKFSPLLTYCNLFKLITKSHIIFTNLPGGSRSVYKSMKWKNIFLLNLACKREKFGNLLLKLLKRLQLWTWKEKKSISFNNLFFTCGSELMNEIFEEIF